MSDSSKYILFDSTLYEPIAESGITGKEYDGNSNCYFAIANNTAVVSNNDNFTDNSVFYESINISD